jgi:hypothetical protein
MFSKEGLFHNVFINFEVLSVLTGTDGVKFVLLCECVSDRSPVSKSIPFGLKY